MQQKSLCKPHRRSWRIWKTKWITPTYLVMTHGAMKIGSSKLTVAGLTESPPHADWPTILDRIGTQRPPLAPKDFKFHEHHQAALDRAQSTPTGCRWICWGACGLRARGLGRRRGATSICTSPSHRQSPRVSRGRSRNTSAHRCTARRFSPRRTPQCG